MRSDQVMSVPPHVLARELEGETVLLNLKNESYYGLDSIGTRIWEGVTKSRSVEQVFEALLAEYDVEPERLQEDMRRLVGDLVDNGLLILSDP